MPARLTVHLPSRAARVVALADAAVVLGRDPGCDVVLDDDRVSRRHALLEPGAESWRLTDLGSKNGTAVDGVPAASAALAERSWMSFGGLLARFERLTPEAARADAEEHRRRVQTSLEIQRSLVPSLGLEALLRRVLDSVLALSGAERGFVVLARAGGDLEVAAAVGLSPSDLGSDEFSGSVGAVERALATGAPVASSDAQADVVLGGRASVLSRGIRALVALPVAASDRRLGVLYADSRKPGAAFTELDLEILEALASQAGLALAVAGLDRELQGIAAAIDPATAGARAFPVTWSGVVASHRSLGVSP